MTKQEIEKISNALDKEGWGDIDSHWFRYLDISKSDDELMEEGYEEYHIALQRLLQKI